MLQNTIINPISCYGIGVHSGERTCINLRPAPDDTGIVFIRTDVAAINNIVKADYIHVTDTMLSTSITNDSKVKVSTIEHLMAAIWGCGVDNLIIEIDGPEVPIMDGSSKPFVFMLECSGLKSLSKFKKILTIKKEIHVEDKDSFIHATPGNSTNIDLTIDFDSKAIGKQNVVFSDDNCFKTEVASSRTFGFLSELEYLQAKGLAKGASLDNAIGIDNDKILNHDGLRHDNEFVKHKLLDLLGDLYTSGGLVFANITGYKTSHNLNNLFLRKLFSDPSSYSWQTT